MAEELNTEKYQGNGRVVGAVGKSGLAAIPGAVAFVFTGRKFMNNAELAEEAGAELTGLASMRSVKGFWPTIISLGVAGAGAVYGLVSGWKDSSRGKKQFEGMKTELGNTRSALEVTTGLSKGLEIRVQELETQAKQHASFAEKHAPAAVHASSHVEKHAPQHGEKPHASHAEKHGEHAEASHAEAALASKAEAEHAGLAH